MTTTLKADPPASLAKRRLDIISFVLVLGAFTTLLDTTIVNIALDHLHTVFGASVAETQWVVTGYLLAFVAVIPVTGWASERFGSRSTWMFAVATFLLGSILCGFATSLPALIAFRVLQGIGGGMVLPITISILTRAAGQGQIGRAMVAVALPAQIAPILGSVLGGVILQSLNWNWLFFVNVPFCVAALVLGPVFLPVTAGVRGHRLDVLGSVLLPPALVAIAYGITQAPEAGFDAPRTWLPLAIGAVLMAGFIIHSLRARQSALIDVRIFARRSFGLTSVITFASGFSVYAVMFLLPLFYQQIRGESVLSTGLLLIPQGLGTMLFFVLLRGLVARLDGRIVVAGGVVLTMMGILPFALAGADGGTALLLAGQILQGVGFGAITFPVMTLALAGLSHEEAPRGSAAFSVVQRVGAPFGVAVIAVILQRLADGAGTTATAYSGAFWWTFALSAVPLVLALFLPGAKKPEPVH
ncbi:MDR family MFS transporter [Clavibacter sp. Sh2088]|uniref:MDR family MFS transporter n=1 Tax=Clavibacter sp. Sh2088 TaxID=3397676 RepID=UPI0039DFC248